VEFVNIAAIAASIAISVGCAPLVSAEYGNWFINIVHGVWMISHNCTKNAPAANARRIIIFLNCIQFRTLIFRKERLITARAPEAVVRRRPGARPHRN